MAATLSILDDPFCFVANHHIHRYVNEESEITQRCQQNEIKHYNTPVERKCNSNKSHDEKNMAVIQKHNKRKTSLPNRQTKNEVIASTVTEEIFKTNDSNGCHPDLATVGCLSTESHNCHNLDDNEWPTPLQSKCFKTENAKKDHKTVTETPCSNKKDTRDKSAKKWRHLELTEFGFNISLFPRIQVADVDSGCNASCEELFFDETYLEFEEAERKLLPFKSVTLLEEGTVGRTHIRRDRHKRKEKAHKQVKHKLCRNVCNNKGRKPLYIHHRIYKLVTIDPPRINCWPKAPREYEGINRSKDKPNAHKVGQTTPNNRGRARQPVQSLAHTLCDDNVPTDIDAGIVSTLMSIQHRDLTPEDYELLLRLDERVAPKTLSDDVLKELKTETIENNFSGDLCPVCLEEYLAGQMKKFLPCGHSFHNNCIEMWLKNSSLNCPLDGLPVGV